MSIPNKSFNEVIVVDGDEHDVVVTKRVDTAVVSTTRTTSSKASTTPMNVSAGSRVGVAARTAVPKAFHLPDGRIMDGKNTLQSFDVATPAVSSSTQ